jgi:large repetitive protein
MKTSRLAVPANPCEVAQHRALVSRHSEEVNRRIAARWYVKLFATLMCLGAIGQVAESASVKLAWNPNPEPDISGYLLSYGTSPGTPSVTVATGKVTTTTLSGLEEGRTYYFSLKAVNTAGLQSNSSAEISHLIPTNQPTNQAPVAANQSLNVTAGTPRAITLAASDADGNSLTYRVVGNPAQGTLSGTAPNLTYTPLATASGSDSFTFRANDGSVDSNTATISISITPAGNTSPVALIPSTGWRLVSASSEETTGENGRATNAFDGNPMTIWHSNWDSYVALPPHEIRIDLGKTESIQGFRYLPRQDGLAYGNIGRYEFHVSSDGSNWGSAVASGSFANDQSEKEVPFPATSGRYILLRAFEDASGGVSCSLAELKLLQGPAVVTPPANAAPVAANQAVTTAEDTARVITLSATDADGQSLVYRVISQPLKGRLSGTAPNLTYTPNAHVNGSDSFTFVANDGTVDSNVAAVAITISAVNDAPVAANQSLNATAGTPLAITLAASDVESNSLTYHVIANPTKGTLSGAAPNLTYTPLATASGADSFTFRANDGSADSNTATVTLNITPAGSTSPVALIPRTGWQLLSVSSEETTGENGRATNAFDSNPNTIWHSTWDSYLALPPHEIRIDLGKSESIQGFRYLPRQDGLSYGNFGRYEFHVSSDGSNWGSPVASGSFVNDQTEKEVFFPATNGRYILLRAFEDASGGVSCSMAELNLIQGPVVTPPPNVAPVAAAQSLTTPEDQAIAIRLAATDSNGDALSYRILSQPTMGTLSGSVPNLTYTPFPDANGNDSFTFRANDGTADSNTATISIAVTAVNDAPLAQSQEAITLEDKSVGILLYATDKEGESLSYSIVGQPTKGKLTGTAPNLTYVPNSDANGSDSFTFRASDGAANSNTATVSIVITPVNDAPVAAARFVSTDSDKPALIVFSASDKDGDALSYMIVSQPMKGVLTGTPPRVTYTPYPGAEGSDTLSFRASDGTVNSNTATISITLVPPLDANAAPEFQFEQILRAKATVGENTPARPSPAPPSTPMATRSPIRGVPVPHG